MSAIYMLHLDDQYYLLLLAILIDFQSLSYLQTNNYTNDF